MSDYFEKKARQSDRDNKKSWRDIDAKKNKNPYSSYQNEDRKPSKLDKQKEALAKKALDDLFTPKKSAEEKKAWAQLVKSKGAELTEMAQSFVSKYGFAKLGGDELLFLLDVRDSQLNLDALTHIETQLKAWPKGKKELLLAKLRLMALSAEDADLIDCCEDLIATLD